MKKSNLWIKCTLGEVAKLKNGYAFKSEEYQNQGIPIVRISDIQDGIVQVDKSKFVYQDAEFEKYTVETGDILIAMSGATTGKFGIYNSTNKAYQNQRVGNLKPVSELGTNKRFLYYLLHSLKRRIEKDAYGGAQPNISSSKIEEIEIELPPLAEQHRIVCKIEELFSELDKGIENLKTARAQLKVYRQALLKHAFEGKLTAEWREQNKDNLETAATLQQRMQTERSARYQQQLTDWQAAGQKGSKPKAPKPLPPLTAKELAKLSDLSEGWTWVKYSELTESSQNGISKRSGDTGINFTVLRLADITNQKVSFDDVRQIMMYEKEIQNYKLSKNDLICIRVNGSVELVGRVISINDDLEAAYCDHFIRYKLLNNVVSNRYIEFFFNTIGVRRFIDLNKVSSAGQNTVNQEMMGTIAVSICSVEEQKIILEMVEEKFSEIDQLEQTINVALQQSEALRQSILKKAFSGTLVPQEANDEPASVLLARIKTEKAVLAPTQQLKPLKMKRSLKVKP